MKIKLFLVINGNNRPSSKKTVLKTMRISDYINTLLEKDAESKGVSVNALISMVMTKYAEWDRFIFQQAK